MNTPATTEDFNQLNSTINLLLQEMRKKIYIVNLDKESRADKLDKDNNHRIAIHDGTNIPHSVYTGESLDRIIKVINCVNSEKMNPKIAAMIAGQSVSKTRAYFMEYYIISRDDLDNFLSILG